VDLGGGVGLRLCVQDRGLALSVVAFFGFVDFKKQC